MTRARLIAKNLWRAPGRTILLIVCIAVAFVTFGVLNGFLASMSPNDEVSGSRDLIVHNRVNLLQTLPIAYFDRVRRVPGVAAVSHLNVLGAYGETPGDTVPLMMVDPDSYLALHADQIKLTAAQRSAFLEERDGLIVDASTASRHGWAVGDHVVLHSRLYVHRDGGNDWPFHIVGLFPTTEAGGLGAFGRYDYLNGDLLVGGDQVHWFTVRTADAASRDRVAATIDYRFANSNFETKSEPASAMARAMLDQIGDVALAIRLIVSAAFVTILLVVGNTVALSVRQRTAEFGTLRAIGFVPWQLARFVLAETTVLFLVGASIGLAIAGLILTALASASGGSRGALGLPHAVALQGIGIALLAALLTGAVPAWRALRITPAAALRR